MRILIMGLPGAGKTTLAAALTAELNADWFNADAIRTLYNDWDFSLEGRIRQSRRMRSLCELSSAKYTIADFVAPLPAMRDAFAPDYTIWVNTISESRFENTNNIFVPPDTCDFVVDTQDAEFWCKLIINAIRTYE